MFKDTKAFSGFAVPDVAKAKEFYGGTLGLNVSEESDLLVLHVAGGTTIIVYPKPDHEPAVFTILNFPVDDIEQAVDDLTNAGVTFERYDEEDLRRTNAGSSSGSAPARARTSPGSGTRPGTSCR